MMETVDRGLVFEYGIASDKSKILNFINKVYKIDFNDSEKWEKVIFSFFAKEMIVPYVIMTSIDENIDWMVKEIQDIFFREIMSSMCIHWSSNECYKQLLKIKEALDAGSRLEDFLSFFFLNNNIIRKMSVKKSDNDDTRFKTYGVSIKPIHYEITTDKGIVYETLFLISPDKDTLLPCNTWHNDISSKWRIKLKRMFRKKANKQRKRDPIESRLRHEVFKRDNYTCKECNKTKENTTLHCDHIIPVSQGGSDELDNLQTLCQACNLAKSNRKWEAGEVKDEGS